MKQNPVDLLYEIAVEAYGADRVDADSFKAAREWAEREINPIEIDKGAAPSDDKVEAVLRKAAGPC